MSTENKQHSSTANFRKVMAIRYRCFEQGAPMANAKQNHWLNIRGPRLFWSSVSCSVKLLMRVQVQVLTHLQ